MAQRARPDSVEPRMSSGPLRAALRKNLGPALVLWAGAGAILAAYHLHDGARAALDALADLKRRAGWWFVMPAQAAAAGLMPWVCQLFRPRGERDILGRHVPWLMLAWGAQGAMTDGFYTLLAGWFGDSAELRVVAVKTAADMLGYTPLVCMPYALAAYALKDAGFDVARMRRELGPRWYRERVWPLYRAALLIWTPTVCLLYALPLALQFPVQAVVQCFFALIVAMLARPAAGEGHAARARR